MAQAKDLAFAPARAWHSAMPTFGGAVLGVAPSFDGMKIQMRPSCSRDRIGAHADFGRVDVLSLDQRGNHRTHAIGLEAPAMIGAFDRGIVHRAARRQRHAAMRANVAQREDFAVAHPADQHRLAQKDRRASGRPREYHAREAGHVPEIAQEQGHGIGARGNSRRPRSFGGFRL